MERAFSTGGLTVQPKRTNLKPENVHKLVFIRDNIGKLDIAKLNITTDEEQRKELEIEKY